MYESVRSGSGSFLEFPDASQGSQWLTTPSKTPGSECEVVGWIGASLVVDAGRGGGARKYRGNVWVGSGDDVLRFLYPVAKPCPTHILSNCN